MRAYPFILIQEKSSLVIASPRQAPLCVEEDPRTRRKYSPDTNTCVRLSSAMFDLLKLPAELRIKIYEYALVRGVIRVVSTVHPFGALHPSSFGDRFEESYEESNPDKAVTLRSRRKTLANTKFVAVNAVGDEISKSYRMQPVRHPPVVNIFLTNRQVYSEAWPIFYQQNAFAFAVPTKPWRSAENCLRFLYDRPYHALQHIRELHLMLGRAPQHPLRRVICSWPVGTLLDEISRYLSLRVLVLYIRGRTDDKGSSRLPPWKEQIWKITGLQELHMDIISMDSDERNTAFVKLLRSKMVVGGEQMGTEGFIYGKRPMACIEWTIRKPMNLLHTTSKYPDMEEHFYQ